MSRRSLISNGSVGLVAAAVTGVALLLGSGSGSPSPASRAQQRSPHGTIVAVVTGRGHATAVSTAYRRLTPAQMRRQAHLVEALCHMAGGPASAMPKTELTLAATQHDRTVDLYVVDSQAIVCETQATGTPAAVGPTASAPTPDDTAISVAGVGAVANHGRRATIEYGRVGAGVRDLAFVLSTGTTVPAAVRGGWFLIWWGGDSTPSAVKLTTASGVKTIDPGPAAESTSVSCPRSKSCMSDSSAMSAVTASGSGIPRGSAAANAASVGDSVSGSVSALAPGPPETSVGPATHGAADRGSIVSVGG